ncbi:hypothetical protein SAMD00019534_068980 [Acytostelium subglobosum LB1]|uniref:hypothetical protein n=1 Tax=Acytostelium subglobosum LB1 TaxID=1410327 RepID=UPI000644E69B|nr:hypothetical protein SAMD00019534_068980 [Acytostelium subglobosum LB1]GAM23723.1 hypothetical protein SAMD00019534_068980 [Acytostelium subglobosum LB1]|eukprot:XP_012753464.1 hypothetical protein SAMD00019534_068980 [Acytostelium subglobosum LB1]
MYTLKRIDRLSELKLSKDKILRDLYQLWRPTSSNDDNGVGINHIMAHGTIKSRLDNGAVQIMITKILIVDREELPTIVPRGPNGDDRSSSLNYIEQFMITGLIPSSEFNHNIGKELVYFDVGCSVKTLIQDIQLDTELITLSLDITRISSSSYFSKHFQLGLYQPKANEQCQTSDIITMLHADNQFTNPLSYQKMLTSLGLDDRGSFLPIPTTTPNERSLDYKSLRSHQNYEWAHDAVTKGIEYAKKGEFEKAIAIYNEALEVDYSHKDAYVALGAAYANTANYDKALLNFRRALDICPGDPNADKYYNATLQKKRSIEQETREKEERRYQLEREREREKRKAADRDKELNSYIRTDKLKSMLQQVDDDHHEQDIDRKKKKRKDGHSGSSSNSSSRHHHHDSTRRSSKY